MNTINRYDSRISMGLLPDRPFALSMALLLALGVAAPGHAGDDTAQMEDQLLELFEQLDADDNGTISLEEAKEDTNLHADYQKADINTDGRLNKTEFSSFESEQEVGPADVTLEE